MEKKLAISCFPGANSRVPDACKQSFSFRKGADMAQQMGDWDHTLITSSCLLGGLWIAMFGFEYL